MKILKQIWLGPVTTLGLLLAAFSKSKYSMPYYDGYLYEANGFILKFLNKGHFSAITIGQLVFIKDLMRTIINRPSLLVHEHKHIQQGFKWGIFWPFAYLGASFWAYKQGLDIYHDNCFEVEAEEAELEFLVRAKIASYGSRLGKVVIPE